MKDAMAINDLTVVITDPVTGRDWYVWRTRRDIGWRSVDVLGNAPPFTLAAWGVAHKALKAAEAAQRRPA